MCRTCYSCDYMCALVDWGWMTTWEWIMHHVRVMGTRQARVRHALVLGLHSFLEIPHPKVNLEQLVDDWQSAPPLGQVLRCSQVRHTYSKTSHKNLCCFLSGVPWFALASGCQHLVSLVHKNK